ncbi:MAG TPA: BatD family protein [Polyangiaceae bacterium]|nr:BatD family protein [Polyangiaceae bacterium]
MRSAFTAVAGLIGLTVLTASSIAHALEVKTAVSSQRVGVGETFLVQLVMMSDGQHGNTVSDVHLPLPAGMTAGQPSRSPQSQVSIINGQMSQRVGVTLTWTVTASKAGSFKVGPPSATFAGEQAKGSPIPIEVVTGGSGSPPQRTRRGFDPFDFLDPFGRGNSPFPPGFNFRSPFDDEPSEEQPPEEPTYPEELRVDKAPDPIAFLRATVTPNPVVVGQQVTLRVFAYGGRGQFSAENPNEPSHADFLTFDSGPEQVKAYLVPVSGIRFIAAKLRELPMFPLHAGTLRAGKMKMGFSGRGYPQATTGGALVRESNWVDLVVTEPPLRGRPAGYKIGDVGAYQLEATVEPRQIVAGEAISVVAKLSGVGNVPFKLQTPESHGVEWLEPALAEKMEVKEGLVQGWRTFSYVVRLTDPGKIDLGELTLPYFDPKRQQYAIARANLGEIEVKANPNASQAKLEPKPNDRLAGILRARETLGPEATPLKPLSDRSGFWAALLLAPFGVVFAGGALSFATRTREKLRERGASLSAQLETALREARELAARDTQGSVAAVERAVFLAIELKLNLKARAILKSELGTTLIERGLPSARAEALARLLEDCDTLRFVGAGSGVDPTELAQRAAKNAAEMRSEKLSTPS